MTGLLAPAWALALSALASVGPSGPSVSIPLDRERWVISADNFKLDPAERQLHDGEVAEFLGRRCMRLSKGLIYARALDVDFRDGVIETDIAFAANGVFFGVAFRVESADQYEVIFLRPGASGTDQAIQYTPGSSAIGGGLNWTHRPANPAVIVAMGLWARSAAGRPPLSR